MQKLATKLPYQLRCKVSLSVEDMEFWLSANCEGAYDLGLEDIVETDSVFNQLEILFSFQSNTDRQNFKSAIRRGEI